MERGESAKARFLSRSVPWCSGLAYVPVKDEIAGSNPVGTAVSNFSMRQRRDRRFHTHNSSVADSNELEDRPDESDDDDPALTDRDAQLALPPRPPGRNRRRRRARMTGKEFAKKVHAWRPA